jgi:hypothetical protein
MHGHRFSQGLILAIWICVSSQLARGQATTVEGSSLLVFPHVVIDSGWSTTIQISNGANRPAYARCFYLNGTRGDPTRPAGLLDPPLCAQAEFALELRPQQPTHWVASRGRLDDPDDPVCQSPPVDCDGAGFDPGVVPVVETGFSGELRCVEVDASGAPWSGNSFHGVATLAHHASGEVVKYPAIGLRGAETNDADDTLCLGSNKQGGCEDDAEYGACPNSWIVSHPTEQDARRVDGISQSTSLTVVPCEADLAAGSPSSVTLQLRLTNEFEQSFTASTTITCWANLRLSDVSGVFHRDVIGASWLKTEVRSTGADPPGFLLVQQNTRETGRPFTFAAAGTVPPHDGTTARSEAIVLPDVVP